MSVEVPPPASDRVWIWLSTNARGRLPCCHEWKAIHNLANSHSFIPWAAWTSAWTSIDQNHAKDESLWPRNDGSIRAVVTLSWVRVSGWNLAISDVAAPSLIKAMRARQYIWAWCRTLPSTCKISSQDLVFWFLLLELLKPSRKMTAFRLMANLRPCNESFICPIRSAFSCLANDSYPSAMHLASPMVDGSNRSAFSGPSCAMGWFWENRSSSSESDGRISSGSTAPPSSQRSSSSTGQSCAALTWKSSILDCKRCCRSAKSRLSFVDASRPSLHASVARNILKMGMSSLHLALDLWSLTASLQFLGLDQLMLYRLWPLQ